MFAAWKMYRVHGRDLGLSVSQSVSQHRNYNPLKQKQNRNHHIKHQLSVLYFILSFFSKFVNHRPPEHDLT